MPGPHPPRAPSRASSSASLGGESSTNAQLEALIGASRAFSRPPPSASTQSNHTYPAAHGALSAAATYGPSKTPTSRTINGIYRVSPSPGVPRNVVAFSPNDKSANIYEARTWDHRETAADSTSQIPHFTRAAGSSQPEISPKREARPVRPRATTTQKPTAAPKSHRMSGDDSGATGARPDRPTDSSPIAPTTSLVDLFERKSSVPTAAGKRPGPIVIKASHDLPMQSPKPVRTSDGGITQLFKMQLEDKRNAPRPVAQDTEAVVSKPQTDGQSQSSDEAFTSAPENQANTRRPIAIPKRTTRDDSPPSIKSQTSPTSIAERIRPPPSPLRLSYTGPIDYQPSRSTVSPSNQYLAVSAQSEKSISAQYHQMYPRRMTPLNTGDDLANAIVASSLASSRAPSPHKAEPPPVPSHRQKYQTRLSFSRTPSPAKQGMLHTLRKIESLESEDEEERHPFGKHKKKRLVRKHPNKHHEGDRKRWRDAVTERERKRYEGLWAANKGMHISFTPEEVEEFRLAPNSEATLARKVLIHESVSNIVTREVWARSRLPDATLEMVWDLVDSDCVGRLGKVEFVVGLWLIDQRLKGRKLPVKVSDSVWVSVRMLHGIKIKK